MDSSNSDLLVRVSAIVESWNNEPELATLMSRFRDDAVLSSPTITDLTGDPTDWLHGIDEIGRHLRAFRKEHSDLRVRDIFIGRRFFAVLLDDHEAYLVHVEPDDADGRIRRMIICRSTNNMTWQVTQGRQAGGIPVRQKN